MKKTVKQWCSEFGYTWFGNGVHGNSRYSYKIIFEKGESAFFAANHQNPMAPKVAVTKNSTFLVFPVFSQLFGKKEISRTQFVSAISWVKACKENGSTPYGAQQNGAPDTLARAGDL
jgi:hypothetical protein